MSNLYPPIHENHFQGGGGIPKNIWGDKRKGNGNRGNENQTNIKYESE